MTSGLHESARHRVRSIVVTPSTSTKAVSTWLAADQAAHSAATRLLRRRLAYLNGHGAEPSAQDEEEVDRLRADARRRYLDAVRSFRGEEATPGPAGG
jgi:hypothetical protein